MTETKRQIEKDRQEEVYLAADALYALKPDWVTFYREVLGLDGIVRQVYSTKELLSEFERTPTYAKIQQMLRELRERETETTGQTEPNRVLTVRLPESLHEALQTEAYDRRTSMNKLCISKLLQFIDSNLVPSALQSRRNHRDKDHRNKKSGTGVDL